MSTSYNFAKAQTQDKTNSNLSLTDAYMHAHVDTSITSQDIILPDLDKISPIKLVALDLDGTTLLEDKTFSPRLIKVIHTLQEQGVFVAICSGRAPESIATFATQLKLEVAHGYCIAFNGGSIINLKDLQKDLYVSSLNAQDLIDIEALARQYDCAVHAYSTRRVLLTESDIVFTEMEIKASMQPFECIAFPQEVNPDERAYKLIVVGDEDKLDLVRMHCPKEFLERFNIARTHENFLEFMEKQCSKGSALVKLCDLLNITVDNVVAFGDAENDIEMIESAQIGVAMGNAMPKVKEVTPYRTLNYTDDGVAIYLEKLFNLA